MAFQPGVLGRGWARGCHVGGNVGGTWVGSGWCVGGVWVARGWNGFTGAAPTPASQADVHDE